MHFDHVLRALSAGRHVIVEKPVTATAGEAEELMARAAGFGRVVIVEPVLRLSTGPNKTLDVSSRTGAYDLGTRLVLARVGAIPPESEAARREVFSHTLRELGRRADDQLRVLRSAAPGDREQG